MAERQFVLPKGAWDSHVHIVDEDHWKINEDAPFHPKQANLDHLLAFEKSIGIDHVCIVAMSVYMTDNACNFDGLRRLNGKGHGIAIIDPDTITDEELDEMHLVGFRGVRINLRTRSQTYGAEVWRQILPKYAARLKRLNWVIQIFVSMDQIEHIAPIVPSLGLRVVFDHVGHPEAGRSPMAQPGCNELYQLLEQNRDVFVKLSGLYRLPDVPELDTHVRKLPQIAPDQIVWASDWPHTGGPEFNPGGNAKEIQDFLVVDIPAFIRQCVGWCYGDEKLIRKIWVDNPRRLWDYQEMD
ncbi:hypothetical protein H2200_006241 [Cladophialophora chaetospira]|uniref:Amidohydrolase-related domain-containing protein n=1 Tax=Cladophialophora chaetospira TaxID=386627 RepID=A0AA39CJ71_9EURO|nr:hypothetical protein H2200_006241 [Cladophialophora chaetospira]